MLNNLFKKIFFKYKYISVIDFLRGKDSRCHKNKNLYIGINNLNEFQISELLKHGYNLIIPPQEIKRKINELNNSPFSNKMINVNIFFYRESYERTKNLHNIIIGSNFKEGIHHMIDFDYIDTIIVNNEIVIK